MTQPTHLNPLMSAMASGLADLSADPELDFGSHPKLQAWTYASLLCTVEELAQLLESRMAEARAMDGLDPNESSVIELVAYHQRSTDLMASTLKRIVLELAQVRPHAVALAIARYMDDIK